MLKRTPKAYSGLAFSQESRRSLETVWCLRTHTLTPFHHYLAAPAAVAVSVSVSAAAQDD